MMKLLSGDYFVSKLIFRYSPFHFILFYFIFCLFVYLFLYFSFRKPMEKLYAVSATGPSQSRKIEMKRELGRFRE